MFANDLLLSFAFMGILFLRQISIIKQPNKINYAPLMIGIGLIASIVHFIIHPEGKDFILIMRESMFPVLVSLLLYIVMNIMHQTQEKEHDKLHDEFSRIMVEQVSQLKNFMNELEGRLNACQQEDRQAQEEIRAKFKEDINALESIQLNQTTFLKKFDEMEEWHERVSKEFDHFTDEEMPKLSSIIHEHIDIFRVSEQDHFNKIKEILEQAGNSRGEIVEDMDQIKEGLKSLQNIADSVAKSITQHVVKNLSSITKSFEYEIGSLKSYSEAIRTSLMESETKLSTIREKSEIIMKQMVLSAKRMDELQERNEVFQGVYSNTKELIDELESVKADYAKAQVKLSAISNELQLHEDEQIKAMKGEIENLSEMLSKKIEDSLVKLHENYQSTSQDISQSVQILAKKAQLQKGYTALDDA